MKLHCNVEINNRLCLTNVIRKKSQRSILAIGRQTVKTNELYILWQTLQNKQGTKYKVKKSKYFSKTEECFICPLYFLVKV